MYPALLLHMWVVVTVCC